MISYLKQRYSAMNDRHVFVMRSFRFLVSGGLGAITVLSFLYLLTDVFHMWYILSAVFAYIASWVVSFLLHKYWTFGNVSTDKMPVQASLYLTFSLFNLALNAFLLYVSVEYLGFHYILGQMITCVIIAGESYLAYHFIFNIKKI